MNVTPAHRIGSVSSITNSETPKKRKRHRLTSIQEACFGEIKLQFRQKEKCIKQLGAKSHDFYAAVSEGLNNLTCKEFSEVRALVAEPYKSESVKRALTCPDTSVVDTSFDTLAKVFHVHVILHTVAPSDAESLQKKLNARQAVSSNDFCVHKYKVGDKADPKLRLLSCADDCFRAITFNRARRNKHSRTSYITWTKEEVITLNHAVQKYKDQGKEVNWQEVAELFPEKDARRCHEKFLCYEKDEKRRSYSKPRTTVQLSTKALEIIQTEPDAQLATKEQIDWEMVATKIKEATGEEYAIGFLKNRYRYLNPNLNKGPWQDWELNILLKNRHLPTRQIEMRIGTRSSMQISQKLKRMNSSYDYGKWSAQECALLEQLLIKYNGDVDCVAAEFPTRNRIQICQHLTSPRVSQLFEKIKKECNINEQEDKSPEKLDEVKDTSTSGQMQSSRN